MAVSELYEFRAYKTALSDADMQAKINLLVAKWPAITPA
jgi:hypothetical protein